MTLTALLYHRFAKKHGLPLWVFLCGSPYFLLQTDVIFRQLFREYSRSRFYKGLQGQSEHQSVCRESRVHSGYIEAASFQDNPTPAFESCRCPHAARGSSCNTPPICTSMKIKRENNCLVILTEIRKFFDFYQVRELSCLNWATVGTWEFSPPSTLTIWPVT